MPEQLTFFASLDFPGRTTLWLREIAERLGCSVKHLLRELESGSLTGLDIRGAGRSRASVRVPVECYRDYVVRKLTGPADFRMRFLLDLPAATRRALILELQASLKTKP